MQISRSFVRLTAISAAVLALAACQTPPAAETTTVVEARSAAAAAPFLRQDSLKGAYEVVHSPANGSIFVATTPLFEDGAAGFVVRLDERDLTPQQSVQLPRRAFGLGMNHVTNRLYVGNTLDGSLQVIDAGSGVMVQNIQLAEVGPDGKADHTRKVVIDEVNNRIFVTSPGKPGKLWIVDGATGTVSHALTLDGVWTAGAAFDPTTNRLYVSQGGVNEILEIDPDNGTVLRAFSTGDTTNPEESKHFFINLAIDPVGKRLFSTDADSGKLYVVDIGSFNEIKQVPIGLGLLDVAYNAARNEIYATNRGVSREQPAGRGGLTVVDGTTYEVKQVYELPVHPNSLAVAEDGGAVYVTVKSPRGDRHPEARKGAVDSVVRIDR